MPVSQEKFLSAVRSKYPGEYDDVEDGKLLRALFKKYPEYIPLVELSKPKLGPEYTPPISRGVGADNAPLRLDTTQPLEVAQPSTLQVQQQQQLPPQQSLVDLTSQALGVESVFDPEGSGYDYETAAKFNITPDETGHWPSRVPETGQLLKGRKHETFGKTITGENEAGYEIYKGAYGRYYSRRTEQFAPSTAILPEQQFADPGGVSDLTSETLGATIPTEPAIATQQTDLKAENEMSDRFMFENLAKAGMLNIPEQSITQSDFKPKREFGDKGPKIGDSMLSSLYRMAGGTYAAADLAASATYDFFARPQNWIADVFDINVGTSAQQMKDNYPEINRAVNKYLLPADVALGEAEKLSASQYYDNSITGYIKDGDYSNAASLLGYQVLENLPQQLEIFGLAFLTGNPSLGISLLSAQAAGGKYHQLQDSDMPDYLKYTNAIDTGLSEYLTESFIGTGPILKRFMGQNWKKSVSKGVSRWLKDIGYGVRQEGFEEIVQTISENIIDITTDNRNKAGELPGIFDGVGDAALVGGVSGGLLSGGTSIATSSKAKEYNNYREAVSLQQKALVELINNRELSTLLGETAELRKPQPIQQLDPNAVPAMDRANISEEEFGGMMGFSTEEISSNSTIKDVIVKAYNDWSKGIDTTIDVQAFKQVIANQDRAKSQQQRQSAEDVPVSEQPQQDAPPTVDVIQYEPTQQIQVMQDLGFKDEDIPTLGQTERNYAIELATRGVDPQDIVDTGITSLSEERDAALILVENKVDLLDAVNSELTQLKDADLMNAIELIKLKYNLDQIAKMTPEQRATRASLSTLPSQAMKQPPIDGKAKPTVKEEVKVQDEAPKKPIVEPKKKAEPSKAEMVTTINHNKAEFEVWRVGNKLELRSKKKDSNGEPAQTLPYSEERLQTYRNRQEGGRKASKTAKENKTIIPVKALDEMPALKAVRGVSVGSDYSGTFDGVLIGNKKVWNEGKEIVTDYDEGIVEGYRDALGLSDEVEISVDDVIEQAQLEIEAYSERGGTLEELKQQELRDNLEKSLIDELETGGMTNDEIEDIVREAEELSRQTDIAFEESRKRDESKEEVKAQQEAKVSEKSTKKKAVKPTKPAKSQSRKKFPAKKDISGEPEPEGTPEGLNLKQRTDETIRKTAILKFIEDQFGVPIRRKITQRMGDAAGKYWTEAEVIRTVLEDLETIAHEIAHHIDKKIPGDWKAKLPATITKELERLDYDQKKRRASEGFAELLRYWLTEDNLDIISPKLDVWFNGAFKRDNIDTFKKLEALKKKMQIWYLQGSVNRVKTSIDFRGEHDERTVKDKVRVAWQKIYKDWIDAFEPLARGVKRFEKKTGIKLRPSQNPFAIATANNLKSRAISKTMIEEGMINEQGEVIGKSLVEVLAPIVKAETVKEWFSPTTSKAIEDFLAYAVALRGKEWLTREKPINPGFSLADANQVIKELHTPERLEAAKAVTLWANQLQDWVIRAANIPEADVQAMRDANPIYLPFQRYFVNEADKINTGSAGTEIGTKTAKGSTRPIVNPLESLITMAQNTVEMANKQRIVNAIIRMSDIEGAGEFVDRVARPMKGIAVDVDDIIEKLFDVGIVADESESTGASLVTFYQAASRYTGKDNVVVVWRGIKQKDGTTKVKPQFYEIDQDLYEALQDSPENYQGNFAMSLAIFARLLRLGATQLSGSFAFISNPARDIPMSLLTSKKDFPTPFGPIQGVIDDIVNSKKSDAWKFKALGGEMATMFGYDRMATMRMLDVMLLKSEGMKGKGLVVVKHPINFLRSFFQIWEMGPRISEFEASFKKYRSKEYTDQGWTTEDALLQARIDAQDLTVNFTRAGTKGRPFNAISAFFNAGVQGVDKIARTAKENPKRFVMRGAMWITSVALFSWWENKDKEWFKNLPLAYKYNNLFFEVDKTVFRVPLPFELGSIFASMPMAMMDKHYNDDPSAVNEMMKQMVGNFVPNLIPSAFKPVWDVATNKNWLGKPIESMGLRMRPRDQRYNERSTALGKSLSKGILGITGRRSDMTLSPVQIDYLLNSYTGGLSGKLVTAYRSTHSDDAADLPVIGRFVLRMPERPSRQINDFYERRKILNQLFTVKGEDGFSLLSEDEEVEHQEYRAMYRDVIEPANEAIREASAEHDNERLRKIYIDIAKRIKEMNLFLYDNQFVK